MQYSVGHFQRVGEFNIEALQPCPKAVKIVPNRNILCFLVKYHKRMKSGIYA